MREYKASLAIRGPDTDKIFTMLHVLFCPCLLLYPFSSDAITHPLCFSTLPPSSITNGSVTQRGAGWSLSKSHVGLTVMPPFPHSAHSEDVTYVKHTLMGLWRVMGNAKGSRCTIFYAHMPKTTSQCGKVRQSYFMDNADSAFIFKKIYKLPYIKCDQW